MEVSIGGLSLSRHRGGIRIDTTRDVERIQTEPKIRPVDHLHDLPARLPRIDVVRPRQGLVYVPDRVRLLLETQVCNPLQIRDYHGFVGRGLGFPRFRIRSEEIRGNLDEIRAQNAGELEPLRELGGDEVFVLCAIQQSFIETEWLETDDGQVEGVAELPYLLGGCDMRAVVLSAGEAVQVIEEELNALVAVLRGLVQFAGQIVYPGST